MIIRLAQEDDAPAMGRVMVTTYLAAHRDHLPAEAWAKRLQEWTPEVSSQGWARTLREIAAEAQPQHCLYVAVDQQRELVGLAMGGPSETENSPTTGEVYALYVQASHQGRGLGRRLVQAVAAHLAQSGITSLQIACLATNAPGRGFYEAIGGRVVAERPFDEEGSILTAVVYHWSDIAVLLPNGSQYRDTE